MVIEPEVVQCAAIAHDLGHPPFGHKGEGVLDSLLCMHGYRYEGNARNFRILTFLEKRMERDGEEIRAGDGLNLTAAVLLATNKYPEPLESEGDVEGKHVRSSFRYWSKLKESSREEWLKRHGMTSPPARLHSKGLYPREWKIIKDLRERWALPDRRRTLEAQIMDLCDDIAYSTHDVEDGIRAGKISPAALLREDSAHEGLVTAIVTELEFEQRKEQQIKEQNRDHEGPYLWLQVGGLEQLEQLVCQVLQNLATDWEGHFKHSDNDHSRARRELKAQWVNQFVTSLGIVKENSWFRVSFLDSDGGKDLALRQALIILKKLAWVTMVQDFRIQRLQQRGQFILERLWKDFRTHPAEAIKLFPADWVRRYHNNKKDIWPWERFVADYIAGFTDGYAEKVFGELYGTHPGSIYGVD